MRDDYRALLQRSNLTEDEMRTIPARSNVNNQAVYEFFCRRHGVPVERILTGTDVTPEEFLNDKLWTDPLTARIQDINAAEAFPVLFHHRDAFNEGQTFVDVLPNLHIIYFRLLPIRTILAQLEKANQRFNNEHRLEAFGLRRGRAHVTLTHHPYRTSNLAGQECNFVRGVLQANFTLHGIKESTVAERYCGTPLRALVEGIYRRFGISYSESAGRVYLDGEEVAKRVLLEPIENDDRTVYRVAESALPPGFNDQDIEAAGGHTALRIVRSFSRGGRTLFHEDEIYDAPHCLFDLSWRPPAPLSAALRQLRTMFSLRGVTQQEMVRHIDHSNRQYFELLEQKQLVIEALESAARQKDAFLRSTAHDLRTPLNGIIGLLENVDRELTETPGAQKREMRLSNRQTWQSVELALGSARRLSHLVDDVLDFSRLRRGEIHIARREVNIVGVLSTTVETVRPLLGEKDVELRLCNSPREVVSVCGDENRLFQVFFNLLGNAVKFTSRGHIWVSCVVRSGVCEVTVSDTGVGIPENAVTQIFEEYEQGDPERGRAYGGSGIGLAVVKRIVELHDGEVSVDSAEGSGSTFTVRLPAVLQTENQLPPSGKKTMNRLRQTGATSYKANVHKPIPTPTRGGSGSGTEVWICDDDAINLEVLRSILTDEGYGVRAFMSGEELLTALKNPRKPQSPQSPFPGVVLLDIMMPRINGFEACRRIRERHPLAELPVILVTARAFSDDLAAGFDAGASDYVAKPVIRQELLSRIELHLSITRAFTAQRLQETRLRLLDSVLSLISFDGGSLPSEAVEDDHSADRAGTGRNAQKVSGTPLDLANRVSSILDTVIRSMEDSNGSAPSTQYQRNSEAIAELRETLSKLGQEHAELISKAFWSSRVDGASEKFSSVLEKLFITVTSSSSKTLRVDASSLGISDREAEIVEQVCLGYGNQEIAEALSIRENTVKRHLYNAFNKLGVDTRAQLIYKVLSFWS